MRRGGVLLHISSLPSPGPIGDLGPTARSFVQWLAECGMSCWQLLPVGPVGEGRSPYASPSAFAGEVSLISLEDLVDQGLLPPHSAPPAATRVDAQAVLDWKKPLLNQAATHLAQREPQALLDFVREQPWAADWALFAALAEVHTERWWDWPRPLRHRQAQALVSARTEHGAAIARHLALQLIFDRQWARLKALAQAHGVEIIGDVPIFVSGIGADTWVHHDQFRMDADGHQEVLAGVPPDYFAELGQLWGNPHYDWPAMAQDNFAWWRARMGRALSLFDVVRLDHFRGFEAAWAIPQGADSAVSGEWTPGPGRALFDALATLPQGLPYIAEDLGIITPPVRALVDELGLPCMKVLQFAFDEPPSLGFQPHNYSSANCVVYTGTHDNDTAAGWYASATQSSQARLRDYAGSDGQEPAWDLMRVAWASIAQRAIAPMQDLLSLGSQERMNVPGQRAGNWGWRMDGWPSADVGLRIQRLNRTYGRS